MCVINKLERRIDEIVQIQYSLKMGVRIPILEQYSCSDFKIWTIFMFIL